MREEKKRRERNHLKRFKECYQHFPTGEVITKERPDFRVHNDKGIYGIEHTRIYLPKSDQGIVLQRQESLKNEITRKAKQLYHDSGDYPKLIVDIYYRQHYGLKLNNYDTILTKNKVDRLANKIAKFVINNIPKPGSRVVLPRMKPSTYKSLPKEIKQIVLQRDKKSKYEIWDPSLGGPRPKLTPELIQKRISNKNKKLKNYEIECFKNWLLIVEEGTQPSKAFDSERESDFLNHTFKTDFDKVFLFRMLDNKVHDLTIK